MFNQKRAKLLWRSLLTETLPYEVPVIFSNDRYYAWLVSDVVDQGVKKELDKILRLQSSGSSPYFYKIGKDRTGYTDLGVIHPLSQLSIAEFYEHYAQSILDFCRKSEFSLRRPTLVTTAFSENEIESEASPKLGIPHITPMEGDIDVSRITSYFAYAKFNLLHRFYDSAEFLGLEKRFSRLRTLDVTKCFFNVYTHTITWAVKERSFAKLFRTAYSFESRFDQLMQRSNSNETNGIVVGPEVSRIFAEIIFQEIDKRILNRLRNARVHGVDYAIRRYVDDYLVFASSENDLDEIEHAIREELGHYKLFVNEKKIATSSRPFVTNISLARREIAVTLADLRPIMQRLSESESDRERRNISRAFSDRVRDIRLIVAKFQIGFHTVSGWLLGTLKPVLKEVIRRAKKAPIASDEIEGITRIAASILEVIFYVCALDLRVRTSYSLCQIISIVSGLNTAGREEHYDSLMHIVSEELRSLIEGLIMKRSRGADEHESIELYNLLICGAHYLGADFAISTVCRRAFEAITSGASVRYFGYITAKFCALKEPSSYSTGLTALNVRVLQTIVTSADRVKDDSELFMLLCDFLSAPDVSLPDKRAALCSVVGGNPSNATLEKLTDYLGFADWLGMRLEHTLLRKELRPAYAWA
jgi:Reverse transcriptase (RNA-dependent DNA polymerase)